MLDGFWAHYDGVLGAVKIFEDKCNGELRDMHSFSNGRILKNKLKTKLLKMELQNFKQ